ncbi:hypothetical protein C8R45DRAFT_297769 [Mycena sanguinolenta]|nr:hypothetical protein C8R45DRAFT_297769 [Mycena sanguinolenta]
MQGQIESCRRTSTVFLAFSSSSRASHAIVGMCTLPSHPSIRIVACQYSLRWRAQRRCSAWSVPDKSIIHDLVCLRAKAILSLTRRASTDITLSTAVICMFRGSTPVRVRQLPLRSGLRIAILAQPDDILLGYQFIRGAAGSYWKREPFPFWSQLEACLLR